MRECARRTRNRGKTAVVIAVLILFAASIGFLLYRSGVIAPGESPRDWPVPDPDLSSMETRVRQFIGQTRQDVLDRPESSLAWGTYAIALDAHFLNDLACESYRRARQLDPQEFKWAYHFAVKRSHQSTPREEVITLLRSALQLDPAYTPGYVHIGDVQVNMGDLAGARSSYEKALELDPEMVIARRSLGQVLLSQGEVEQAVEHLERADRLKANDRAVATALAQAYMKMGLKDRSREQAQRSRNLMPQIGLLDPLREEVDDQGKSTRLCDERAVRRMGQGRFREAINDLLIVIEKYPDDAMTNFRLGACYESTQQITKAIRHLERAVELDDDLVGAHLQLARIFWGKDAIRVIRHYRRTIELSPPSADLNALLATALAMTGDIEAAQLSAEKAIEIDADHSNAHYLLGEIHRQGGRIEEAITHYRHALRSDPSSPAAGPLMELTSGKQSGD